MNFAIFLNNDAFLSIFFQTTLLCLSFEHLSTSPTKFPIPMPCDCLIPQSETAK